MFTGIASKCLAVFSRAPACRFVSQIVHSMQGLLSGQAIFPIALVRSSLFVFPGTVAGLPRQAAERQRCREGGFGQF
jgi:hypothetical protein